MQLEFKRPNLNAGNDMVRLGELLQLQTALNLFNRGSSFSHDE